MQRLDRGNECGVVFDVTKDLPLERGDIIESYIEKETDSEKFKHKLGVSKSF